MKWYNKTLEKKFLIDLGLTLKKIGKDGDVLQFSKLAFKFVRQTGVEESKVGVLDKNDITQIAFEGLIQSWNAVDWEKISNSDNGMKSLVNYLSSNISGRIKRRTLYDATGVHIPESYRKKTIAEEIADKLFGNWLYQFKLDDFAGDHVIRFSQLLEYDNSPSKSWENEHLNELLTTEMFKILSDKERDILRWSYGLEGEKLSSYEIGDALKMNANAVRKAQERAIKKLAKYSDKKIFEDFL